MQANVRIRLTSDRRRQWTGMVFVLPVVLGTLLFNVIPAIGSLALSFTAWDLLTPPRFIGLENFRGLLTDPIARGALRNTIVFVLGSVVLGMVGSLALALLVNRPLRGISLFRLAFFLPVVSSVVAVGLIWQYLLNSKLGLVNGLLADLFGITGPSWLTDPRLALLSLIVASVWMGLGTNMLIFVAGLQNIPEDLYGAAKIDGAGMWRRFLDITLPLLSPTSFFILIISIINSFQVFGLVYVLTITEGSGGRNRATDVWIYYLWQNAFSYFRMGYASAMAWVLFIVIGLLTVIQWRVSQRWVHYE